jgi:hypothetical protein
MPPTSSSFAAAHHPFHNLPYGPVILFTQKDGRASFFTEPLLFASLLTLVSA